MEPFGLQTARLCPPKSGFQSMGGYLVPGVYKSLWPVHRASSTAVHALSRRWYSVLRKVKEIS